MTIFIDPADQDPSIPEHQGMRYCPDCPGEVELEAGYGMAGGGMGAYTYCPRCSRIMSKVQDKNMEDDR